MADVSAADRLHWDGTYSSRGDVDPDAVRIPADFAACEREFPTGGTALDIACGSGAAAVWLARRGLEVTGIDISEVALGKARELAEHWEVSDRCRFAAVDLDGGLPPGPPVDVIVCHRFRVPDLYGSIAGRLKPGGLLAVSVLSEVGAHAGRYRARPGELAAAFTGVDTIATGEGNGIAWLLARKA